MASTCLLGRIDDAVLPNIEDLKWRIRSLMKELNRVAGRLEVLQARYQGYTLCYTWVTNSSGRKYFYYYLKSKSRTPKSIYLGKAPRVTGATEIRSLRRLVARACAVLSMLYSRLDLVMLVLELEEKGGNGANEG